MASRHSSFSFTIRAGLPAIITLSGKQPQTTLPAPTTTFFPNEVPFRMMEMAPMKQPSPITIGRFLPCLIVPLDIAGYKEEDGSRCR